ncbi:antitoxin Xre/MbcA/ParS toxin-binding domain-containing protein [Allosphingosinicella humi]
MDRLEREAALMQPAGSDGAGAVFRVLEGLSAAWALTQAEQLALLGLADYGELQGARTKSIAEIPVGSIERLAILLDIFQAINILLPNPKRADAWIRKANKAPPFKGASALSVMLSGLQGLRNVRAYLTSQRYGG